MIILNLQCDNAHRFEGWFASSETFREQQKRALVNCPQCDSLTVSQLPSAPYIRRHGVARDDQATDQKSSGAASGPSSAPVATAAHPSLPVTVAAELSPPAQALQKLVASLATLARQAEDVGERFPEEARRIHYEEIPPRAIRGVATVDEALDLLDEGIMVLPTPVPPHNETH